MQKMLLLSLLPFLNFPTLAQTPPDVAEILRKVGETYKAASDYQVTADLTVKSKDGTTSKGKLLIAFRSPNRYRLEGTLPGLGTGNGTGEGVVVHDGTAVWMYMPSSNQYVTFPAAALTAKDAGDLADLRPEAMDNFMLSRYRGAANLASSAKYLRQESVDFGGVQVPCYVVAITLIPGATNTWWIDTREYRILREDTHDSTADSSAAFRSIQIGGAITDSLFRFVPPPGAKKMDVPK